jgi:hypothetical protein
MLTVMTAASKDTAAIRTVRDEQQQHCYNNEVAETQAYEAKAAMKAGDTDRM